MAALATMPLLAQTADPEPDPQIAQRLAAAKSRLSVETVQDRCRSARKAGEIVVCVDRGEDQRVPTTAETDPDSLAARRALNNGVPRAPAFSRSCKGQPGCITGGWAPPPIYVIDPAALPEAPEGSDADKIAKGELPDR
ncbi:MAG: hypothetical protein U9R07_03190 [Pseudomonadota bacterium]|nr:hypothetical protein [Pseudomonadota bacterium]